MMVLWWCIIINSVEFTGFKFSFNSEEKCNISLLSEMNVFTTIYTNISVNTVCSSKGIHTRVSTFPSFRKYLLFYHPIYISRITYYSVLKTETIKTNSDLYVKFRFLNFTQSEDRALCASGGSFSNYSKIINVVENVNIARTTVSQKVTTCDLQPILIVTLGLVWC